jgi:hypothetical protein
LNFQSKIDDTSQLRRMAWGNFMRRSLRSIIGGIFFGSIFSFAISLAQAAPVEVSYTISGSAGNWTYDFSVTNNLGGTNDIYLLTVKLPATNVTGSPGGWHFEPGDVDFNFSFFGSSSTLYNDPWFADTSHIFTGQTLSGFLALDASTAPLTTVPWLIFALNSDTYLGPGCFHCGSNPGFEGVANAVSTPLPASLPLFASGLAALGWLGCRRKKPRA